jgi:hypothetical protein
MFTRENYDRPLDLEVAYFKTNQYVMVKYG